MFNLAHELISEVEINGRAYQIDMSFNNILLLFEMLEDDEMLWEIKVITAFKLLLDEVPEGDIAELATILNDLLKNVISEESQKQKVYDIQGNEIPAHLLNQEEDEDGGEYDLIEDAKYIYASFMQDYGIDLFEQHGKMHWYKFKALLAGLSEQTKFSRVMEIRNMPIPKGKGTGKQAEQVKKLKRAYALKKRGAK